jgi:hypothetical protein
VSIARLLKRLIGGAAPLRNFIAWIFIALVALFLTHPSGGPFTATGMQLPWPAKLELNDSMGPQMPNPVN